MAERLLEVNGSGERRIRMSKKIEGSYTSIDDTIQAVHTLLKDGHYLSSDIHIITNRANREHLEELTSVSVDKVSTLENQSAWVKFKKMFSSANEEATLEKYGIEMHDAVKFEEDLKDGHYIILVEEDPQEDLSQDSEVSSISDAIVDARDEQYINEQSIQQQKEDSFHNTDTVDEEDPLLNGSVDRGPIYGVVNEETKPSSLEKDKDKNG